MVKVTEGGDPQKVPLVYYDEDGNRTIVGEAAVQLVNGEVIALGQLTEKIPLIETNGLSLNGLGMESFSVDVGPTPIEEASARLGMLRQGQPNHVTARNPNGEVKPCARIAVHPPHEWYIHPADFFAVYCPGKSNS